MLPTEVGELMKVWIGDIPAGPKAAVSAAPGGAPAEGLQLTSVFQSSPLVPPTHVKMAAVLFSRAATQMINRNTRQEVICISGFSVRHTLAEQINRRKEKCFPCNENIGAN